LYTGDLGDLYSSSNFIQVIKSRRMRWEVMWYVVRTGELRTGFRGGNLKE
jgi:hypothetical protein